MPYFFYDKRQMLQFHQSARVMSFSIIILNFMKDQGKVLVLKGTVKSKPIHAIKEVHMSDSVVVSTYLHFCRL